MIHGLSIHYCYTQLKIEINAQLYLKLPDFLQNSFAVFIEFQTYGSMGANNCVQGVGRSIFSCKILT